MKSIAAKLLLLLVAAIGIGILIPGIVLAGGHGHSHGGHGHHGHHSDFGVALGFGYYDYYPYYSPYYYPPAVSVESPKPQPQPYAQPASSANVDMDKFLKDLKKTRFTEQFQQGDKSKKLNAINQLAGLTDDDQVRAMLENSLQTDQDPAIRKAAADALGSGRSQKSLPVLEKTRVEDSDLSVRQAAESAIKQIKG